MTYICPDGTKGSNAIRLYEMSGDHFGVTGTDWSNWDRLAQPGQISNIHNCNKNVYLSVPQMCKNIVLNHFIPVFNCSEY